MKSALEEGYLQTVGVHDLMYCDSIVLDVDLSVYNYLKREAQRRCHPQLRARARWDGDVGQLINTTTTATEDRQVSDQS